MQLGVYSLHADSNHHYGTGKGTTIYRFTSNQFYSYYTKIIHTNSRDISDIKLFTMDNADKYSNSENFLRGKVNKKV